jgi:cyclic-di-GMP-binding protein
MLEPALTWIRSLKDPFRNPNAAAQWIAGLPTTDAMALQKEALELVTNFPGSRRIVGPAQAEALLRVDARLEPVLAQLAQQYATNYQKSTDMETRLWHAVFDLVKAFAAAYGVVLRAGYPRADHKRWQALLPWILVRLVHYRGVDAKFRLFRYGTWIPAQWREFHELYEFARARGWQRSELAPGMFSRPGACVEQEYLKTLLLMRLDSGNFTPDQVEWVARQLDGWAASLMLVPPPGVGASFFIDLTGSQGLRRQDKTPSGDRVLLLDAGPIYTQIVERMRWLPERDDDAPRADDPPPREQRLLLMRLASLYGPDAISQSPRATRFTTSADVRVVVGLAPLTRAIAEIDRLPDKARLAGVAASYDEVTDMVGPAVGPETAMRRVRGFLWKMEDRSDTGCRLTAPAKEAPAKLGEILALKEGDTWALAVVRRMQRHEVDETTVGIEIVGRRLVRVLMRNWVTPTDMGRAGADKPFFGIYLPAHPENRQMAQRSLIGPDERFVTGGMVELDTGNARYLIRFTQTLERQPGWAWTLFSAVRKLTP